MIELAHPAVCEVEVFEACEHCDKGCWRGRQRRQGRRRAPRRCSFCGRCSGLYRQEPLFEYLDGDTPRIAVRYSTALVIVDADAIKDLHEVGVEETQVSAALA